MIRLLTAGDANLAFVSGQYHFITVVGVVIMYV